MDLALYGLQSQVVGADLGLDLIHMIENLSIKEAEGAPDHILVAAPGLTQEATPEVGLSLTVHAREEDIHLLTEDITGLLLDTGHVAGHVHIIEVAIQEAALGHIVEDTMALCAVPTLLHSEVGEVVQGPGLAAEHHCA